MERDYAELINGLRDCSRRNARVCTICGAKASNLCDGTKAKRMFYAADAIEELQAKNDKQTMMIRKQSERTKELLAAVPKWISVEDAMPEVANKVLTYNGNYVFENWLCTVASKVGRINVWAYSEGFVTHWMPLPEPPKEELNKNVE